MHYVGKTAWHTASGGVSDSQCHQPIFNNIEFDTKKLDIGQKNRLPFGLKATFLPPEFWRMKGEKEASAEYGDEGHP